MWCTALSAISSKSARSNYCQQGTCLSLAKQHKHRPSQALTDTNTREISSFKYNLPVSSFSKTSLSPAPIKSQPKQKKYLSLLPTYSTLHKTHSDLITPSFNSFFQCLLFSKGCELTEGKEVPFSFCIHSGSFRTCPTLCKQIYCQGRTAEYTWSGLGAQHPWEMQSSEEAPFLELKEERVVLWKRCR